MHTWATATGHNGDLTSANNRFEPPSDAAVEEAGHDHTEEEGENDGNVISNKRVFTACSQPTPNVAPRERRLVARARMRLDAWVCCCACCCCTRAPVRVAVGCAGRDASQKEQAPCCCARGPHIASASVSDCDCPASSSVAWCFCSAAAATVVVLDDDEDG